MRQQVFERASQTQFDIVVVGGGITGAGAVRDAARRGLRVAMVEADDIASGTSSRSSKLVHGGLRYLEQYEFSLVFEAVSEDCRRTPCRNTVAWDLLPGRNSAVPGCAECFSAAASSGGNRGERQRI